MAFFEQSLSEYSVSSAQAAKIYEYAELILKINQVTNLTGAKDIQEFFQKHILDAVLANKVVRDEKKMPDRIYDIGSGGGIPGIVLGILNDIPVTLVERRERKAERLQEMVTILGLENIDVINNSFELISINPSRKNEFWFKGFLPADKMITYFSQSFKHPEKLSEIVLMKGPSWSEELTRALAQPKLNNDWVARFVSHGSADYELPNEMGARKIIFI